MTPIIAIAQRDDSTEFRPLVVPVTRIEDDGTQPSRLIHDCAGPGWLVSLYLHAARPHLTLMGERVHDTYGSALEALREAHRRHLASQGKRPDRTDREAAPLDDPATWAGQKTLGRFIP